LFSKIYKTVLQNLFCRFLKLFLYSVLIVYCTITVFQICSFLVRRERSQRKTIIPRSSE
jgi:predicted permease